MVEFCIFRMYCCKNYILEKRLFKKLLLFENEKLFLFYYLKLKAGNDLRQINKQIFSPFSNRKWMNKKFGACHVVLNEIRKEIAELYFWVLLRFWKFRLFWLNLFRRCLLNIEVFLRKNFKSFFFLFLILRSLQSLYFF